jgi:hypothetical protein
MTTISNTHIFYNNDDPAVATTAIEINRDNSHIILGRNLTTTPAYITISPNAISDGTNSTNLTRLSALQTALAAVELPPNATTLKLNETLLCDAGIANQTTSITDGQITINGTGLNNNPLLSLNTGSGNGILYQEVYNQRTAQTGEFSRTSFYGKNSAGTKTEYARIHQNAPVITAGSTKGRIDLGVNINGSMTDYLTLNGTAGSVALGANLDCNNFQITEISNASTINNFSLTSQSVNFVSSAGNSTPAGTKDNNMRAVYCNTGVPDSLEAVAGTFPSTWGNITCSVTWSSGVSGTAFWVGTDTGKLYWTNNNGVSWNIPNNSSNDYTFNAKIRCIASYNGRLWIGGDFTSESITGSTYNYICYLDSNEILQQAVWVSLMGSNGVNAPVYTMVENSSYLYFGGAFTTDDTGVLGVNKLGIVDTGTNLQDTDGQLTGLNGNGFFGAYINQILINGAYPDNMAVCGDISQFVSNLMLQTLSCDNFCIWRFSGNQTNNTALYPSLQGSVILNAMSLSVLRNGGSFYVGGNFTNTQEVGSGNPLPYFFHIVYDGSTAWNQDGNPYTFVATAPINQQLHLNGLWWADTNGALYKDGNFLVNAPFSSNWSWIGDETTGNWFSTNSPTQNPITMYYWNTSDAISIALSNPLVAPDGNTYTGNLVLNAKGSNAELVWNAGDNNWYVLSTQGGVGYN